MAKVATSGEEARERKFLRPYDQIELNRDQQLWTAKRMAIGMAEEGYRPPLPRTFNLPGERGPRDLQDVPPQHEADPLDLLPRREDRDPPRPASSRGGDTTINDPVDEQTILDLEREAFLSLCGEPKTQDRIKYMLVNNKPLQKLGKERTRCVKPSSSPSPAPRSAGPRRAASRTPAPRYFAAEMLKALVERTPGLEQGHGRRHHHRLRHARGRAGHEHRPPDRPRSPASRSRSRP